ncbi:hypothetical protein D9M70_431260 [compost metagenome]
MASIPNSEYRHSQRTDGGPFAALQPLDELGLPTSIREEITEVEVYYSDAPVPQGVAIGAKPWIRIMSIAANLITIWPVQQRGDHSDYGEPLFDSIERLCIVERTDGPYGLPTTIEEFDDFLLSLPTGFYKNWRYGLGLRWEFRSIITTIAEIPGITTVCFMVQPTFLVLTELRGLSTAWGWIAIIGCAGKLLLQPGGTSALHARKRPQSATTDCYIELHHSNSARKAFLYLRTRWQTSPLVRMVRSYWQRGINEPLWL